jgi:molybdopterin molybdotransferase
VKPFGELIPFEEALRIIDGHISPIGRTETIAIDEALGRVAAADVTAGFDTPSYNRALLDGYAVKAADTAGATPAFPRTLRLVDCLFAGSVAEGALAAGECIQIATGAMMPEGADAVIMVEETRRDSQEVTIFKSLDPQSCIGFRGEDTRKGEKVIAEGQQLNPGRIGILASQGLVEVLVYRKPVVAVMPTGKEVIEVGSSLKTGQLYDINSHTIAAVVRENGGIPRTLRVTGDSVEAIESSLKSALAADMVVTSGGSSMGEKDLIINVLEAWGKVYFHGIKVKPGKPMAFALVQDKPVIGLPGNPTSCLLDAYLLLGPAIRKMGRLPGKGSVEVRVVLAERVAAGTDRVRFQAVKVAGGKAFPVVKESGAITAVAYADGYIVVPQGEVIEQGTIVAVSIF